MAPCAICFLIVIFLFAVGTPGVFTVWWMVFMPSVFYLCCLSCLLTTNWSQWLICLLKPSCIR